MRSARRAVAAVVVATAVAAGGCSGSSDRLDTSAASGAPTPSTSPSASPTESPQQRASREAVAAYLVNQRDGDQELADPAHKPVGGTRYTTKELYDSNLRLLVRLRDNGIVFRGTRPTYRPVVQQVDLQAKPPRIVIRDCALTHDWRPVYVKTGKSALRPGINVMDRPILNTMIMTDGRWLLSKLEPRSGQC